MPWTTLAALLAVLTLTGCTSEGSPASGSDPGDGATATGSPMAPSGLGCRADYTPKPLPRWARTGFHPPAQPVPYVLGDRGDIVAILWADHHPLTAPPAEDRNNKILWVARVGASSGAPLRVRATLDGTGRTATRSLPGGAGPSLVDLPSPGCWSVDLTWGGHQDHLRLEYARP